MLSLLKWGKLLCDRCYSQGVLIEKIPFQSAPEDIQNEVVVSKIFYISSLKLGKIPILTSIFLKGVETTNQTRILDTLPK